MFDLLLGPEYQKETLDIEPLDILNRLCLYFAILIFILLAVLFQYLERHHRHEHLAFVEDLQQNKTFRSKHLTVRKPAFVHSTSVKKALHKTDLSTFEFLLFMLHIRRSSYPFLMVGNL